MNMASIVVLGIVAVLLVFSIVSFRKRNVGRCDGNCGACIYSCNMQEGIK